MYHYYVRCSFYKEGKKVGDWYCECSREKLITHMSDISDIEDEIKTLIKNERRDISFTNVVIDFYHLLRKDSD